MDSNKPKPGNPQGPKAAKSDRELEAAASTWLAKRDHGMRPADEAALADWLAEDPRHARAFANSEKAWNELSKLRRLPPEKLEALLSPGRRRQPVWPVWAAGLAAAVAVAIFFHHQGPVDVAPEIPGIAYTAGATTEARFTLPDGSTADLRRGSEIRVLEGGGPAAIRVTLVRGEAHFTVAKKNADKFVVRVGELDVRDLGTAFDVQRGTEQVTVLVTEGRVVLTTKNESTAPQIVKVGEAARVVTAGGAPSIEIHSVSGDEFARHLAWRNRRLVFSRTPLAEAVAEMNRYNRHRLEITDGATAAVLVTGSFESNNLDAFVRLLEDSFGIAAERGIPGKTVLRKAN